MSVYKYPVNTCIYAYACVILRYIMLGRKPVPEEFFWGLLWNNGWGACCDYMTVPPLICEAFPDWFCFLSEMFMRGTVPHKFPSRPCNCGWFSLAVCSLRNDESAAIFTVVVAWCCLLSRQETKDTEIALNLKTSESVQTGNLQEVRGKSLQPNLVNLAEQQQTQETLSNPGWLEEVYPLGMVTSWEWRWLPVNRWITGVYHPFSPSI